MTCASHFIVSSSLCKSLIVDQRNVFQKNKNTMSSLIGVDLKWD